MEKNNVIYTERIAIGISACCMGCPVRYNGKGWDMLKHLGREKSDFKWCPVCTESMAGLGVPRDPIHIAGSDGSQVWTGEAHIKTRGGKDVTQDVIAGAKACMETLNRAGAFAYVYMDGSPTCGVYRTTLKNQKRGKPPGVFGSLLLDNGFFLIPSTDLQSPLKWWDWRRRLLAFAWLRTLPLNSKQELFEAWYKLKFLCQELDNEWSREMGRKLAALETKGFLEFVSIFRADVLSLLRKPSTTPKITGSLWKNYAHYRKASGKSVDEVRSPEFRRNITAIASELLLMERTAIADGVLFGTAPVLYRTRKRIEERSQSDGGIENEGE